AHCGVEDDEFYEWMAWTAFHAFKRELNPLQGFMPIETPVAGEREQGKDFIRRSLLTLVAGIRACLMGRNRRDLTSSEPTADNKCDSNHMPQERFHIGGISRRRALTQATTLIQCDLHATFLHENLDVRFRVIKRNNLAPGFALRLSQKSDHRNILGMCRFGF